MLESDFHDWSVNLKIRRMPRATFVCALILSAISISAQGPGRFTVVEATIPQMQAAMQAQQMGQRPSPAAAMGRALPPGILGRMRNMQGM